MFKVVRFIIVMMIINFSGFAQDDFASVLNSSGSVFVKPNNTTDFNINAENGTRLHVGDAIMTTDDGFVVVEFTKDKSLLNICMNSEISIQEEKNIKKVKIIEGKLLANVTPGIKGSFRIETPTSVAFIKGTKFWTISSKHYGDRFYGVEGKVGIMNLITGLETTLNAGQMAISTPQGQLSIMPIDESDIPHCPGEPSLPSSTPESYTEKDHLKQSFPPDLILENLKLIEPSYNRALDGLEEGKIQFDLINNGRGNAYDIEVKITPLSQSKHLSFPGTTEIDEISKKDRKTINIPISADIDIESMPRQFRIEINEGFGFDTDPAIISFETQAFIPPDLQIKQVAIDDNEDAEGQGFSYGNGNSIIESGESIEVTAYVQNFGDGDAENVKAEVVLKTDDPNITYVDAGKVFNLGDIKSGDFQKVDFYFYTSRRYDEENIPISIKLTEVKGKFGKTIDLGLKSGKRTQNVLETQIARAQVQSKKTQMRQIEGTIKLSDVDKDIPKTNMDSNNILAVIIGIEEYKYAPSVDFASNDARTFYQYAKDVFGIPERNIYYRINDGATAGEFNKIFSENGWIDRRLKKLETDVIIYYSGHGAPDTQSKKGYLIPSDIDPNYATTGFSIDDMYLFLSKLQAKSVTLFLDACFSGESRSQEMLIAGIRPISVKIKNDGFVKSHKSL